MKPAARLQLKLGQKLRLAPQLRQAIALLALNRIELRQTLREALDTNPLLERAEDSLSGSGDADPESSPDVRHDSEVEIDFSKDKDYGFDDLPPGYQASSGP